MKKWKDTELNEDEIFERLNLSLYSMDLENYLFAPNLRHPLPISVNFTNCDKFNKNLKKVPEEAAQMQ